jgi:hypothetical protein
MQYLRNICYYAIKFGITTENTLTDTFSVNFSQKYPHYGSKNFDISFGHFLDGVRLPNFIRQMIVGNEAQHITN